MLVTCLSCKSPLFVSSSTVAEGEAVIACGACGASLAVNAAGAMRVAEQAAPAEPSPEVPSQGGVQSQLEAAPSVAQQGAATAAADDVQAAPPPSVQPESDSDSPRAGDALADSSQHGENGFLSHSEDAPAAPHEASVPAMLPQEPVGNETGVAGQPALSLPEFDDAAAAPSGYATQTHMRLEVFPPADPTPPAGFASQPMPPEPMSVAPAFSPEPSAPLEPPPDIAAAPAPALEPPAAPPPPALHVPVQVPDLPPEPPHQKVAEPSPDQSAAPPVHEPADSWVVGHSTPPAPPDLPSSSAEAALTEPGLDIPLAPSAAPPADTCLSGQAQSPVHQPEPEKNGDGAGLGPVQRGQGDFATALTNLPDEVVAPPDEAAPAGLEVAIAAPQGAVATEAFAQADAAPADAMSFFATDDAVDVVSQTPEPAPQASFAPEVGPESNHPTPVPVIDDSVPPPAAAPADPWASVPTPAVPSSPADAAPAFSPTAQTAHSAAMADPSPPPEFLGNVPAVDDLASSAANSELVPAIKETWEVHDPGATAAAPMASPHSPGPDLQDAWQVQQQARAPLKEDPQKNIVEYAQEEAPWLDDADDAVKRRRWPMWVGGAGAVCAAAIAIWTVAGGKASDKPSAEQQAAPAEQAAPADITKEAEPVDSMDGAKDGELTAGGDDEVVDFIGLEDDAQVAAWQAGQRKANRRRGFANDGAAGRGGRGRSAAKYQRAQAVQNAEPRAVDPPNAGSSPSSDTASSKQEAAAAPPRPSAAELAAQHYRQGNLYLNERKVQLAINEFNKALEHRPEYGLVFRSLGSAYMLLGRERSAINAYRRFVALEPKHKDAARVQQIIAAYDAKKQ